MRSPCSFETSGPLLSAFPPRVPGPLPSPPTASPTSLPSKWVLPVTVRDRPLPTPVTWPYCRASSKIHWCGTLLQDSPWGTLRVVLRLGNPRRRFHPFDPDPVKSRRSDSPSHLCPANMVMRARRHLYSRRSDTCGVCAELRSPDFRVQSHTDPTRGLDIRPWPRPEKNRTSGVEEGHRDIAGTRHSQIKTQV